MKALNFYQLLNIEATASSKDIKLAFLKACEKNSSNMENRQHIENAYNILIHPDTRRIYDLSLKSTKYNWNMVLAFEAEKDAEELSIDSRLVANLTSC